ncbi:hypothetical protein MKX03_022566 [Papaver bracteatum]|nr:hypothetical protein MKX03_022566 [Papaver bracteatum]
MGKKRKSDASRLEEVDRTMYTAFRSGANSLSQLYSQAMNHQKLSFQAGERHAQEKLCQWILRQQEEGSRVTTANILAYLQNELDYGGEEPHQPTVNNIMNSGPHVSSGSFGPTTVGPGIGHPRSLHPDHQVKNSIFSNALSSPVRRSLQHYHLSQDQTRDSNPPSSNDSSMDMHDSPGHDSAC